VKVLTIIHLYPPHHLGGYEVACQGVMDRFVEQGIEVTVLTADHRMAGVAESHSSVQVRRLLKGWWDWEKWEPVRLTLRQRWVVERHNQEALSQTLAEVQPDVVSIWDLGMMSWCLATMVERRRLPIVLTFLDDWITFAYVFDAWSRIFDRRPWLRPMAAALGMESRLPTFEHAVVSSASRTIEEAVSSRSRWKLPTSEIVPFGVENRDFPISEPPGALWRWRVLYVGRLVPEKGVATLVKAMAELPLARLEVVGHGHSSAVADLTSLATQLGVAERVSFSTASSRGDLRDRYRAADVVVFPSEWAEPFGLVPLEAMACGVPVVATGTGGSGEYLEDGVNAVLFPPGDASSLAGAVRRMAGDAALRARIVSGGTETASRMTMDLCAQRLEVLHRRATGELAAVAV
jgi:glycogen(starch) synthase